MRPDRSEIWRHAIVGILIASLLAGFHAVSDFLSQHRDFALWIRISWWLFLIGAIGVGFAVLSAFESYLWRKRLAEKIHLDEIGIIDGQWLDAVVQNGQVIQAGIKTIESSRAEGFTAWGDSFHVKDCEVRFQEPSNSFKGKRGSVFGPDGISYVWEGTMREAPGTERKRFGVAYYTFSPGEQKEKINYFKGAFLARQEESILHVIGRNVPDALSSADVKSLLQLWVKDKKVSDFIAEIAAMQQKAIATAGSTSIR